MLVRSFLTVSRPWLSGRLRSTSAQSAQSPMLPKSISARRTTCRHSASTPASSSVAWMRYASAVSSSTSRSCSGMASVSGRVGALGLDGRESAEMAVEWRPGRPEQICFRERLFDECHAGIEPALGCQDRASVAGHVEDLDLRLDRLYPVGYLLAEHVRHDDVGDEQVDLSVVVPGDVECLGAVGGGDHPVTVAREDPLRHLTEGFLVLDDQDGLSGGSPLVRHGIAGRSGNLVGDGK